MKKLYTFISIGVISLLIGCAPVITNLSGNYQDKPFEVNSPRPLDSVWSSVIDLFAQKGISIKIIDKGSGLIVTEKTSFLKNYSIEKDGKPSKPDAWIVLNYITYGGMDLKPTQVFGEWNVRVKTNNSGGTLININLNNIDALIHYDRTQYTAEKTIIFDGRSTGKFEGIIADFIK